MTSQSIYNFLFSRYTLFTFSLFLILVSMSAWLSLSEYGLKINDKIYQIDQFQTSDADSKMVYMLFSADDSVRDLDFVCKNADLDELLDYIILSYILYLKTTYLNTFCD